MRDDLIPTSYDGRLVKLIEEAAELTVELMNIVRAATKIQMHGEVATDEKTGITYDNVADLRKHVGRMREEQSDVERMLELTLDPLGSKT